MKKLFLILIIPLFLFFVIGQVRADDPDLPIMEGGALVPCGGYVYDDDGNPVGKREDCTICHLFLLINNLIGFIMFTIVPGVAVVMLIIGGAMLFFGGTSPEKLNFAKSILVSVVIGLAIIFCAWIIINTILVQSRIVDPAGDEYRLLEWHKITCGE